MPEWVSSSHTKTHKGNTRSLSTMSVSHLINCAAALVFRTTYLITIPLKSLSNDRVVDVDTSDSGSEFEVAENTSESESENDNDMDKEDHSIEYEDDDRYITSSNRGIKKHHKTQVSCALALPHHLCVSPHALSNPCALSPCKHTLLSRRVSRNNR